MSYEYYHICVAALSGGHQSDCSNSLKLLTGESGINDGAAVKKQTKNE